MGVCRTGDAGERGGANASEAIQQAREISLGVNRKSSACGTLTAGSRASGVKPDSRLTESSKFLILEAVTAPV
jgi:hypothetical protein